ncbi:HEPN domain-containing protein [candidate division KSB1 bacterium]|nr:HEPN domain-containing protein [candidate division KSB1 bacterium]
MNEIELEIEKSKEDLRAVKVLLDNNILSAAVNRSYYSIFHIANALLLKLNLRVNPITV